MGILIGLLTALTWGGADFTARFSTHRIGTLRTMFYMQFVGFLLLTLFMRWLGGWGHLADGSGWPPWAWGFLAGLLNACGTLSLYRSFEIGKMAVVARRGSSFLRTSGWHPLHFAGRGRRCRRRARSLRRFSRTSKNQYSRHRLGVRGRNCLWRSVLAARDSRCAPRRCGASRMDDSLDQCGADGMHHFFCRAGYAPSARWRPLDGSRYGYV